MRLKILEMYTFNSTPGTKSTDILNSSKGNISHTETSRYLIVDIIGIPSFSGSKLPEQLNQIYSVILFHIIVPIPLNVFQHFSFSDHIQLTEFLQSNMAWGSS